MIERFVGIVGEAHVIREDAAMQPYMTEWRGTYQGRAALVLSPGSTAEVSAILKLASETGTKIVTQGGNTGLTGAQIPFEHGGEILLSTRRLTKIRRVDAASDAMIVEAGVTLAAAQNAARAADRLFPLSLASEGSCSIGGNIATNAGGTAVIAYGNMRDLVLGLEVVLASGEIWNGIKALRKDNAGYDLKQMFIGSEGTLGIITAASLRLFPAPRGRAVALAGLNSPAEAIALYAQAREKAGLSLTALELIPRFGMDMMVKHMGKGDPIAKAFPWYVLVELSGADSFISHVERMLEILPENAAIAQSERQANELWSLREGLSEAQKFEGASIKHDVSVPISSLSDFIAETLAELAQKFPGCRPLPFGHAGDGNLHFNISQPEGENSADFRAKTPEINALVHGFALKFGGSIAAEHGIGRMKRELLAEVKSPVEMEMMRGLKRMLDPANILNPGKVV
ncbi:MAG: FAD-binding oxidoreductase [Aestuariivirgaceae bacterium]|nr:FAD-binding oxidoreductase [Aestuariivirgaceae bacterium]